MAPKKENENTNIRRRKQPEKNSDEYYRKRERNNVAVKKSRDKARIKQKETSQLVGKLRQENAELDRKVKLLSKELEVLRDIFLSHAAGLKGDPTPIHVKEEHIETEEVPDQAVALMDHEYCS